MWCSAKQVCEPPDDTAVAAHRAEEPAARGGDERIGDAERERGAGLVQRAFAEGMLDVGELEQGLAAVYRSVTAGELEAALAVLPQQWMAELSETERRARRAQRRRAAHREQVRTYTWVMALLVAIWLLTALTAEPRHFWPIWPMLGWGIPLLVSRPRPPRARSAAAGVTLPTR